MWPPLEIMVPTALHSVLKPAVIITIKTWRQHYATSLGLYLPLTSITYNRMWFTLIADNRSTFVITNINVKNTYRWRRVSKNSNHVRTWITQILGRLGLHPRPNYKTEICHGNCTALEWSKLTSLDKGLHFHFDQSCLTDIYRESAWSAIGMIGLLSSVSTSVCL